MTEIESDLAGQVWKILVKEGDEVEVDQPLLILESMKMEIPVVSPDAGRVARLLVGEGDQVTEGQVVAELS